MNLLRSAFWGQEEDDGEMGRSIPWTVEKLGGKKMEPILFTGQIIVTANRPLGNLPELEALKTRTEICHLEVERDEILALGKKLTMKGYKYKNGILTPVECLEVFQHFSDKLPEDVIPDLRVIVRAWRRHIGLKATGQLHKWKKLLDNSIQQIEKPSESPASSRANLEELAKKLRSKYGEDFKRLLPEWKRLTGGKSKNAYYRALKKGDSR